jgi:hypothetical protein
MTAVFIGIAVVACLLSSVACYVRGHWTGMASGILQARDEIRSTTEVAEHCRQQWAIWEQKAESYRSLNSDILLERDKWQHLYSDQSAAHGNAQALMMGAIDYMGRKLDAAGIKFQVPPVLAEVQRQFVSDHLTPAIQQVSTTCNQQADPSEKVQQKTSEVG